MSWLALIKNALAFANAIMGLIQSHRERGAGWAQATAQALTTAAAQAADAKHEIENAERIHAKDSSDSAFDQDFKRG